MGPSKPEINHQHREFNQTAKTLNIQNAPLAKQKQTQSCQVNENKNYQLSDVRKRSALKSLHVGR
jgi:hypothetical protein